MFWGWIVTKRSIYCDSRIRVADKILNWGSSGPHNASSNSSIATAACDSVKLARKSQNELCTFHARLSRSTMLDDDCIWKYYLPRFKTFISHQNTSPISRAQVSKKFATPEQFSSKPTKPSWSHACHVPALGLVIFLASIRDPCDLLSSPAPVVVAFLTSRLPCVSIVSS